eukprot:1154061-Pelagomonas_calceolata.AAC.2
MEDALPSLVSVNLHACKQHLACFCYTYKRGDKCRHSGVRAVVQLVGYGGVLESAAAPACQMRVACPASCRRSLAVAS